MRAFLVVIGALGFGLLTGGLLAFVFGGWIQSAPVAVTRLGPFNGNWEPSDYCFFGALLASAGAVLAGGCLLGAKIIGPRESGRR